MTGRFVWCRVRGSRNVYAGDASGRVEIFGAPALEPDATSAAPTNITSTSATINGSVNPDGLAATYQFQYGTSLSYGSVAPAAPGIVGSIKLSMTFSVGRVDTGSDLSLPDRRHQRERYELQP